MDVPFLRTIIAVIGIALDPKSSKRDRYAATQVISLYHSEIDLDHLKAAWRVLQRARAT